MSTQRGAYELWIESLSRSFAVQSLRGSEGLSRPYHFDLALVTERVVSGHEASLVGRAATLTMAHGDHGARRVRGLIASQQIEDHAALPGHHRVRVRLVPRLWLLRRRRGSRIYQNLSVPEVVTDVLQRLGVRHRWALDGRYPALDYCVQYRETDYDFVSRLLAETGIFYYFAQPTQALADVESLLPGDARTVADSAGLTLGGESLEGVGTAGELAEEVVFCDHARSYPALTQGVGAGGEPGTASAVLTFASVDASGEHDARAVTDFAYRNELRSNATELRGYDFQQPQGRPTARATVTERGVPSRGVTPLVAAEPLEIYDHHDEYGRGAIRRQDSRRELERFQSRVLRGRGASFAREMAPGYRFTLDAHPHPELNQEYVLTRVDHEADDPAVTSAAAPPGIPERAEHPAVYRNKFACIPADVTWRPRNPPRHLQQSLEMATVVGPAGEAIYTDELARVKVRFHWDREGPGDEGSSCWIRVAQPWAGPGMGQQWIPRVGHEVLVAFIEGDTDRPMVIGSAYNGANAPPFGLPGDKTRSGVRTQSTPGDAGYNELSFEDASGAEQVRLHAERDLDVTVNHDAHETVGHETLLKVGYEAGVQGSSLHVNADHFDFHTNGIFEVAVNLVETGDARPAPGQQPVSALRVHQEYADMRVGFLGGTAVMLEPTAVQLGVGFMDSLTYTGPWLGLDPNSVNLFATDTISVSLSRDPPKITLACGGNTLVISAEGIALTTTGSVTTSMVTIDGVPFGLHHHAGPVGPVAPMPPTPPA